MAPRSPQDMNRVALRPQASTRFQGAVAPKIDTSFIGNLDKTLDSTESVRLKKEQDDIKFMQADFENFGDEISVKAKAALVNTEGLSAIDEDKKQKEGIQKALQKKFDSIPEKYQPYIQPKMRESLIKYDSTATPHVYGQVKKVQDGAFKSRIVNRANDAVEGSADLEYLGGEGIAKVSQAIAERAERLYGSDPDRFVSPGVKAGDLVTNEIMVGKSDTFRRAVEQQANTGRIDLAEQILERFDPELTPADRVKANKLIEAAKKTMGTKDALTLATEAQRVSGGDRRMTEAYIQENSANQKEYFSAIQAARIDWDIEDKMNQKQVEDAKEKILTGVGQGKGMRDPEIQAALLQIPADDRDQFLDRVNKYGKGNVITDQAAYDRIERILQDGSDDQIRSLNLNSQADLLGRADLEMFSQWKSRRVSEKNKEFAAVQRNGDKEVGIIATEIARINKISRPDEVGKLKLLARESANMHLSANPRLSAPELRKKVYADLQTKGVAQVPKKDSIRNLFGLMDPGTRAAPAESLDLGPAVHPSVRNFLKQAKPNWTESQVNKHIENLIKNGVDVSSPRQ